MYRRGETLMFRRAIPERFRSHFDGRREVQKSLDTNEIAEARHRWSIELAKFEAVIARAKSAGRSPLADPQFTPTVGDIEAGVRAWLTDRLSRADAGDATNPDKLAAALRSVADLEAISTAVSASAALGGGGPTQQTEWLAEELIARNHWLIAPGSELYRRLIRVVARGQAHPTENRRR